ACVAPVAMMRSQPAASEHGFLPVRSARFERDLPPNPLRHSVLESVRANPGILQSELAASLACNRGTLRYHLETLARCGQVHFVRHGQRSAVFPAGADPREHHALAVLQRGRTRELAALVLSDPGITQTRVAQRLGLSRKILRKYADRMLEQGLVRELR